MATALIAARSRYTYSVIEYKKRIRRHRFAVAALMLIAFFFGLAAVGNWWGTWQAFQIRLAIAGYLHGGYNGCTCDDCLKGVLGISGPLTYGCFPPSWRAGEWAVADGTAALACVALALVGPVILPGLRDPSKCRRCGYDIRGLPEPRCPECGERGEC